MLPSLADITALLEAECRGPDPGLTPNGVCTDSRRVQPGDLFFALRGENHDGHDYVAAALAAGALAAVVARRPEEVPPEAPLIVVADPLRAYGRLARWWREQSPARVLAVTGSTGKTGTKAFLAAILSRLGPILTAPGTENNEIGVPRALLQLTPEHRYCVLEFGMRGPGEIAYLAEIARPEIGVITNIGTSHLGRLGGREAIAQAKAELLVALPAEGRAVLNADDFFYGLLCEMAPCPVVSFGLAAEAQVRAEALVLRGLEGSDFTLCLAGEKLPVSLALPGRHHVLNALAAAAAAWAGGASPEQIREGLQAAQGETMRCEVLTLPGPVTVINDAYNASPTSVAAAVDLLASLPGRRILVLGDMLELGQFAEAEHRQIGRQAARAGIDRLIAVGPAAAAAAASAGEIGLPSVPVAGPAEALELLRELLRPGDTVLVKASRAMRLEELVEGLRDAHRTE
jgi:UDP-N-acetylmuramoyl-tripeptide--D-alanyl-D-alanine ligase